MRHNEATKGERQTRIKCNLNRISACNLIPFQFGAVCGEIIWKANINKSCYKECMGAIWIDWGLMRSLVDGGSIDL